MNINELNWQPLYEQMISIKQYENDDNAKFWIRRYAKFVTWIKSIPRIYDSKFHEKHHMIPRSWNGSDTKENLVILTFREHIIAHYIIQHTRDASMIKAFHCMYNISDRYNFRISTTKYDEIKQYVRENAKYQNAIPVIRISDGMRFISATEAERQIDAVQGAVRNAIIKVIKCKDSYWQYEEDYLEGKPIITHERILPPNTKPVICIDTGEIFDSIAKAEQKYPGSIRLAVERHLKADGKTWRYYDKENQCIIENEPDKSYLHPVTPEQQLAKNKKISESVKGKYTGANSNHGRKVIRLDTLEIFDTARIASLKFSNNKCAVASAIKSNYKFDNARWQYYDDYLTGIQLPEQQISSRFKGHKHSEESKKRVSETLKALKKEPVNKVKVQNIDTGEVFDSIMAVSKDSRFNCKNISTAFWKADGLQCRCGGYSWKKLI